MGRHTTKDWLPWNPSYRPGPFPSVSEIPAFSRDLIQLELFRSIFNSVYDVSEIGKGEALIML